MQGLLAHAVASTSLTLVHLILTALLTAALAAYSTAWAFIINLECTISQASYSGCNLTTCPCALTSSCSTAELGDPGCATCTAPTSEACEPAIKSLNIYLLSFNGLIFLITALPVICVDVYLLMLGAARRNAHAARMAAIVVGVEQQTRLVCAGDKPTVTPGTLTDWVTILLAKGDVFGKTVGEKCRDSLRGRGFELPVKNPKKKGPGSPGQKQNIAVNCAPPGSGGGDEYSAAEQGGISPAMLNNNPRRSNSRLRRVTPEESPGSYSGLESNHSSYHITS